MLTVLKYMEENKFRSAETYDYLKHLTTLSSGSIILITTFESKFGVELRALLRWSVGFLLASLFFALFCMMGVIANGKTPKEKVPQSELNLVANLTMASLLTLFVGLLCIGLFGMLNI